MKIIILNTDLVLDEEALKALPTGEGSINGGEIKFVVSTEECYKYQPNVGIEGALPADSGGGVWVEDHHLMDYVTLIKDDSFDESINGDADISSIEAWNNHGEPLIGTAVGFKDWRCLRREIKLLIMDKCSNDVNANWNNLDSEEKLIACSYIPNIVSYTTKLEILGNVEVVDAIGLNFDTISMEAREQRYMVARTYLIKKIGKKKAIEFSTDCAIPKYDIRKGNYVTLYTEGVEQKSDYGTLGMIDMIDGDESVHDAASDEQLKALVHRTYPVIDGSGNSIEVVAATLVDILVNGTY